MRANREEFKQSAVDELLVKCHRRCCVCHRFCGVKIILHHIEPATRTGAGTISNAIPLCFDCHAEVRHYDPEHPIGRKYRPGELRQHKEQWLTMCEKVPEVLAENRGFQEVGPFQATLDELEYNLEVARRHGQVNLGAIFFYSGFQRAIEAGVICLLRKTSKDALISAYANMMKANSLLNAALPQKTGTLTCSYLWGQADKVVRETSPLIEAAIKQLVSPDDL